MIHGSSQACKEVQGGCLPTASLESHLLRHLGSYQQATNTSNFMDAEQNSSCDTVNYAQGLGLK